MVDFQSISKGVISIVKILPIQRYIPLMKVTVVAIIVILILEFIRKNITKKLLARATTKSQISNIDIFSRFIKYLIYISVFVGGVIAYAGSWSGLGISAGLFSAAMGWALQRPIVGVAAWIILILKRPFEVGDRIMIGDLEGNVTHMTITHITLMESASVYSVPNSVIFEKNIVNLTPRIDDYMTDAVSMKMTFQSDLKRLSKIAKAAAKKHAKEYLKDREPEVRLSYDTGWPPGLMFQLRYPVPPRKLYETRAKITNEIYHKCKKIKEIKFAT